MQHSFFIVTLLLSSVTSIYSMHTAELELFTGQGKKAVQLAYPYCSPTEQEKKDMKLVGEGCYTVLSKPTDVAFLGPFRPCQLVALSNKKKAVAAHNVYSADISTLMSSAKEELGNSSPSEIQAVCFAYDMKDQYDTPTIRVQVRGQEDRDMSCKDLYAGKSQREVLLETKDLIIKEFGIQNRQQVQARIFSSALPDLALGEL